ncbi:fumarylacetoacetate hydrolase family protein [Sporosarcina sp. NPDC096371]|uniref:fumarylacetoacetate hydrolase family protein n=1 Tax=Sporosarcina sp. NPDC096371 TaxID=3364530 RepID=UPI003816F052
MSRASLRVLGARELISADVNIVNNTVTIGEGVVHANELPLDIPVTGMVIGTLLNYKGALEKLGDTVQAKPYCSPPTAPVLYLKPANTFNRYGSTIPMPVGVSKLEVGAALGLVIGKQAIAVDEEHALNYVAGYTIVNDVSVPHVSLFRPAVQHRARDGFCPIGPWVIDHQEVPDPDNLVIRVFINDVLRQENTTSNLIRPIRRLLADVTEFMTLRPGDVLLVGVPEAAPLAEVGDHIRIDIAGIGSLENRIVDEQQFNSWGTT